jgi:hypothetical protein
MENVLGKRCRENRNTLYFSITFFYIKPCSLYDNVEKYGRAGQATDDNITGRMRPS